MFARYSKKNEKNPKCTDKESAWSDESVLRWFSHVERMENDWTAKRVYVG